MFAITEDEQAGRFIDVSEEACTLLGYTRDELRQCTPLDLSYPEASERFPALLASLRVSNQMSFQGAYRHKDGTYIELEYNSSLIPTSSGQFVLTHARDLRERLQFERDLLRVSTESRMIFDLCPDMIGVVTGEHLTDINQAGILLMRATDRQSVIGLRFWDFVHPDYHPLIQQRLLQNDHSGKPNAPVEQAYVRCDGTIVKVEVKSTRLPDAENHVPRYLFLTRDITREIEQRDYLTHLAYRDFLTGLWNRRKLLDELTRMTMDTACALAIFCLDIDHFKYVNDTHGHDIGDLLLVEVATRLRALETPELFVARTGGDEFCIVYTGSQAQTPVEQLSAVIIDVFQSPFMLGVHTLICSTSVGTAIYNETLTSARDLLKAADIALYQAKARGRNQAVTYLPVH